MPNKESWIEEFDKEFDHYENGDSWCDSYDNKECSCFVARVKTFIQKIVIPQVKEQVMKEVMMCVLEEKDLKEVIESEQEEWLRAYAYWNAYRETLLFNLKDKGLI